MVKKISRKKQKQTVCIGADHAGFKLKNSLKKFLVDKGFTVIDVGAKTLKPTDDYPDYAVKVSKQVVKKDSLGILVCGSAEGMCIAANKIKGIRAVAVWNTTNARLSRQHNNANVLCLSGWKLSVTLAQKIVKTFVNTSFSEEKRHKRRVQKIARLER